MLGASWSQFSRRRLGSRRAGAVDLSGIAWAFVAAGFFGLTQILNRKSNQLVDAHRTAFGLLLAAELVLLIRAFLGGDVAELSEASIESVAFFAGATLIHYVAGWTLLALSQQGIGVARTGALVAATPLVASLLASFFLAEPLTWFTLAGVVMVMAGVALVSLSRSVALGSRQFARPWPALTVCLLWGTSPLLVRQGLEGFDAPVLGLTLGLGVSLSLHALGLLLFRRRRSEKLMPRAVMWMGLGGLSGALAISAQWISFDLTTIAVSITVQQGAALVVLAVAPLVFREPLERINLRLIGGVVAILGGSTIVVLAGG